VTGHHTNGLRLITLPIKEMKKGRINILFDTGATLTLIKNQNYWKNKGNNIDRRQRSTTKDVKDDFPIDYAGILGMDFLQKHKINNDQKTYLQVDGVTLCCTSRCNKILIWDSIRSKGWNPRGKTRKVVKIVEQTHTAPHFY
ncbi:hypothetical protein ALC62_08908, partial [Cyphomyrmex costatus]